VSYSYGSGYTLSGTAADFTIAGANGSDRLRNIEVVMFLGGEQISAADLMGGIQAAGNISISDASVAEGSSGSKVATFTVTRSGGSAAFAVNYATANGTATAGSDYVAASGVLNFAAGVNMQTVAVTVLGDTWAEFDETFVVNLSGATNGALMTDGQGLGIIVNDDTATGSVIYGTNVSDTINVAQGVGGSFATVRDDFIYGLDGNDTLDGGAGADSLFGGSGDDTYFVDNMNDWVFENPGEGTDIVRVTVSGYTLTANAEIAAVATANGLTLSAHATQAGILFGNIGDDTLIGGAGNDQFAGGPGNDTIVGGGGADAMGGGSGDDTYFVDSVNDGVFENPGEGTDIVRVTVSGYTLTANVEIGAVATANGLTLSAHAAQAGILFGNIGDDTLIGGAGNDQFAGGPGNDRIVGGGGIDAIGGGPGDDTFVFRPGDGIDYIADFVAGNGSGDVLDIAGFGVSNFAQLQSHLSQNGNDVQIFFDNNNQIVLQNVSLAQLNQGDFLLLA